MKQQTLLIIGTGYIASALGKVLETTGCQVKYLSRVKNRVGFKNVYYWNPSQNIIDLDALKNVSTIINLSGDNIAAKRWTKSRKEVLVKSRIEPLYFLHKIIKAHKFQHIKHLISTSAIGYYNHHASSSQAFNENDKQGQDFLSQLCVQWEQAAQRLQTLEINVIILRLGIVISTRGGALQKMVSLAKKGLLLPLGTGQQIVSWICIKDLIQLYLYLITNQVQNGIYNAVADNCTNLEFTKQINRKYSFINLNIKIPTWFLKIILGELSCMLTSGYMVNNTKIQQAGFNFEIKDLNVNLI